MLESGERFLSALACSQEIPAVVFQTRQTDQRGGLASSVMYGAADVECFAQVRHRSFILAAVPVESAQVP